MITNSISTIEMPHDEWLKIRFKSIGASESGSILGLNPYKTAVDVYYEKVDRVTDFTDNLNMKLGRELEPIIKKLFEEDTGYKVRNDHKIRVDKEHSFLTTNLDGMIVGENAPVEYKALGRWDGEIPLYYYSQVQHQLMITGSEYAYFVVLVLSAQKSFIKQKIERNDEFIGQMREEEVAFWKENVMKNIPPEPTTKDDAKKIYADSVQDSSFETSSPDIINKVNLLIETKAEMKESKALCDNLQMELMETMQENESLVNQDTGHTLCTWKKSNDSLRFDAKRLKEENPEVYSKYMKQTTGTRRFIIKGGQNG